jgi:hypothetical protein
VKFIIPVESVTKNKGGVILYDPDKNKILKQYVHDKTWTYRVGWRGGILYGDYFIATDWTDIHYFNHKTWTYERSFKKDSFNDLHYLEIKDDQLYVVNTGIDAIEIFNNPLNPEFVRIIRLYEKFPKIFQNRDIDPKGKYNEKFKVKPHSAHPNAICMGEKNIYVTCFEKQGRHNSGEFVTLDGKRAIKPGWSCHDGDIYKGNFYTTLTRQAKVLVFNNIENRKYPIRKPDRVLPISRKGWWRGSIIKSGKLYVFASYRHRRTALLCIMDLKSGKTKFKMLPQKGNVVWDTVYQPNLYKE